MRWYLSPLPGSSCYWAVPLSFAQASLLNTPDKNLAAARNPSCWFVSLHKHAKWDWDRRSVLGQRHLHMWELHCAVKSIPCSSPVPCFGISWSQKGQKVEIWVLQSQKLPQSTWWGSCTSSGHSITSVHGKVNTNKYSQGCGLIYSIRNKHLLRPKPASCMSFFLYALKVERKISYKCLTHP